jgi:hypothetical protein
MSSDETTCKKGECPLCHRSIQDGEEDKTNCTAARHDYYIYTSRCDGRFMAQSRPICFTCYSASSTRCIRCLFPYLVRLSCNEDDVPKADTDMPDLYRVAYSSAHYEACGMCGSCHVGQYPGHVWCIRCQTWVPENEPCAGIPMFFTDRGPRSSECLSDSSM